MNNSSQTTEPSVAKQPEQSLPNYQTGSPFRGSPNNTKFLVGVLIGLVVVLMFIVVTLAFVVVVGSTKNDQEKITKEQASPTETSKNLEPSKSAENVAKPVAEEGWQWLSQQQKVAVLPIFSDQPMTANEELNLILDYKKAVFYKVATNPNDKSELFNAHIPLNEMGNAELLLRVVKKQTGELKAIEDETLDDYHREELVKALKSTVVFEKMEIAELSTPKEIAVPELKSTLTKLYNATTEYFSDYKKLEKVTDVTYGSIYKEYSNLLEGFPQIFSRKIYLRLKDNTMIAYELAEENKIGQAKSAVIWNDGSSNTENYHQNLIVGCGGSYFGSLPVIKDGSSNISSKQLIGKTAATLGSKPVYQVMSSNEPVVQAVYGVYKIGRENDATALSIETFAKTKNHFLWQDALGDWQIYINEAYSPLAECGKPVIYLYPTAPTQVSVAVAADITKSEPAYPTGGWLVLADPNGKLQLQGQSYESLFWEGKGHGLYPNYQDYGVVVDQASLVVTLKNQLSDLGLNQQEAADFMDFWQEKLPRTPYVRLTWLKTGDMDRLAPLTVEPKPDTSIRIFLEFEGLHEPKKLQAQKLTAPQRKGFTLVEWGGLLIGEQK